MKSCVRADRTNSYDVSWKAASRRFSRRGVSNTATLCDKPFDPPRPWNHKSDPSLRDAPSTHLSASDYRYNQNPMKKEPKQQSLPSSADSSRTRKKQKRHHVDSSSKEQLHSKLSSDKAKRPKQDNTRAPDASTSTLPITVTDLDYRYILAPMVGASELAFRLLCRNYGATLAYTPMMSAKDFADQLRPDQTQDFPCDFQTCRQDRPLVCHFGASQPDEFARAVTAAAPYCDAVDLNLGCPQRTAYLGHFGSYLLDPKDRILLCDIVRAGAEAGRRATPKPVPIFVKIRLLETLDETTELCQQLVDSGAALIAIHARYRATWDRKGPGARDGPALLDQVAAIRQALPTNVPIIANGNVRSYQDVLSNLESTRANGIMSAEGLLDDPTLFLPCLGALEDDGDKLVTIHTVDHNPSRTSERCQKQLKLEKKLHSIAKTERKLAQGKTVSDEKRKKLESKTKYLRELTEIKTKSCNSSASLQTTTVTLRELYQRASDKIGVAREYLGFVRVFPVSMRTAIFHIRRMLKSHLTQYQLMEECLTSQSIEQIEAILSKMEGYAANPDTFVYDRLKAQQDKEALERKKREEGKRKAYEERMIRKAKREGKADLHYYLHIGAAVPTTDELEGLKRLDKDTQLQAWKKSHSQHCMTFHLDPNGCQRGRSCCFLHVPPSGANAFDESDEIAG